ncbi:hypothetical protein [Lysinibacillus sp. ZYM-1]|uniref:hypothetical protein n=1 Tax=Lysinibacillus sp. ZYM-1 TaxID=1681184 RepID=UPI0006CE92A9|nr:hypothetical protein [Lysinibacillus sp. ZYM-1]KPN97422.1 hypothetical protein AO843_13090 [Lysinibacillus sp. ZYM-1]
MNEMILDIINSYNGYLEKIPQGCESIIKKAKSEVPLEAMQLISQFTEGVDWLVQVNEKLASLGYENPLYVMKIHEYLEEINKGLEIQDFLRVADIFEYEIKPYFESIPPYEIPIN